MLNKITNVWDLVTYTLGWRVIVIQVQWQWGLLAGQESCVCVVEGCGVPGGRVESDWNRE